MSKKKTDPFEELKAAPRKITPRMLTGENKRRWDKFAADYEAGEYDGIAMRKLYEWGQENLGLSCSISSFRNALIGQ
jgi:hypothetical protein